MGAVSEPSQVVNDHCVHPDLEKASSVQRRMTPALEVMTRLFPHQQEALAWMVRMDIRHIPASEPSTCAATTSKLWQQAVSMSVV